LRLGRGVAEKNLVVLIEQHNAIGQRLPVAAISMAISVSRLAICSRRSFSWR
jgi:hypothetical protein